jgi:hypothetical protein
MTEAKSMGISKTMFIVGLIAAILASSLISAVIVTQLPTAKGPKGDKGDKGDTGATGATGPQGSQGPKGDTGLQGPATVFSTWSLTWYTLSGSLQWGASVGTSTWGSVFDHDFGTGNNLFQGYSTYIGFQATMTVNMQRDGPVHFVIGSDDGSQLYVDGTLWIDNYGSHPYAEKGVTKDLARGTHTLTLWYFQVTGSARVSFNCDPDILMWNP